MTIIIYSRVFRCRCLFNVLCCSLKNEIILVEHFMMILPVISERYKPSPKMRNKFILCLPTVNQKQILLEVNLSEIDDVC